ncbi:glycosyltransferase family 1 protein [Plenodomus tracheiphilus IPT5]|uniref:UDP-N-acetylglucosamine transferase subunit ALG13 n=1 Tax=Plenodomus tracheiphilus IPT5 TaxID=1408161 RepID=A0A6A7BCU1_9PLEO|nr:glycosyltransferase family 1 protein [Plenodomus tracheiphilus IPT5]
MAQAWNWTSDSKLCFVTTGATAPFTALIESVLSPSNLDTLQSLGFTHILVQYGSAKDVYSSSLEGAQAHLQQHEQKRPLVIDGLDFDPDSLKSQFRLVQQSKGLVISHAGSGTILAALRYQIPLVVVPNADLLDNHQEELAVAMERQNYVVKGDVRNLTPALLKSEDFRVKMSQFPPITSRKHRETKSFAAIMDETVGFLD